jgi:hypothetical protein
MPDKRSVREKILDNIEQTLIKIDLNDGYNYTVLEGNVKRVLKSPTDLKFFPTLFIIVGFDESLETPLSISSFTMKITIVCCVHEDNMEKMPRAVEDILSDVRRVMLVDSTRGGFAIDTNEAGATQPNLNDITTPFAYIEASFDIVYRTARGDPRTVA